MTDQELHDFAQRLLPWEKRAWLDLEGYADERRGVQYMGRATKQENGKYVCLANVNGALCTVEVSVKERESE